MKTQLDAKLEACTVKHDATAVRVSGKKEWGERSDAVSSMYMDPFLAGNWPWVDTLLGRELQVVMEAAPSTGRWVDFSQNPERSTFDPQPDVGLMVQCVTPSGSLWDRVYHRELLGIEALALQGVFVDPATLDKYSNAELHNLAGNAFPAMIVWLL